MGETTAAKAALVFMTSKTSIHAQNSPDIRFEIERINYTSKASESKFTLTKFIVINGEDRAEFEIFTDSEVAITTLPAREFKA